MSVFVDLLFAQGYIHDAALAQSLAERPAAATASAEPVRREAAEPACRDMPLAAGCG